MATKTTRGHKCHVSWYSSNNVGLLDSNDIAVVGGDQMLEISKYFSINVGLLDSNV